MSILPVFIGGHARSGTTLLGSMLGSHDECICTPESPFKIRLVNSNEINIAGQINIQAAIESIKDDWRFQIWDLDIENDLLPLRKSLTIFEFIEMIVRLYGKKIRKESARIWIDHTPSNIRHADILLDLFKNSKMIHIVRDGRGVASSIIPLDWGSNTIYEAAMNWEKRVHDGIAQEKKWGQDRILRINYEKLVLESEDVLKTICSFLNLEFREEMMNSSGFRIPKYTEKQHALVGKNCDSTRVDAWERSLSPRQVEIFENIAGPLLSKMGYKLKYRGMAKRITGLEKLYYGMLNKYRKLQNDKIRRDRIKRGVSRGGL